MPPSLTEISPHLHRARDTCNVYLLRHGADAILIDFGAGAVLGVIPEGQPAPCAVVVTHHHRDQVQGLARAAAAGMQIWVPPVERELIETVDEHWQARPIANTYDVRQDRFSLLEPVPVTGSVPEYRDLQLGSVRVRPVPTPGHTIGSVSYLAEVDGQRVAFVGDLLYAPGKVWSLAATMWSYGEHGGAAATILSLLALKRERLDVLLPSHGEPIRDVDAAIDRTVDELWR
ncbi:MAG TPA: MBL fold metallo-hydrolase, partial [Candidatus Limnocylindria bacterium]|nr:MBL fold metallo-hydrolase [Candidatus Limnocylindria bacterium]